MTKTEPNNAQLDWLESESIHIIREVAAECENPALLFSGGKDSVVLLALACKAFRLGSRPVKLPFPLVHIDTGHNYPEVIAFRDAQAAKLNARLIVGRVEDSIAKGTVVLRKETDSRNAAQAVTLLETIEANGFDALMGGARRDEEKPAPKNGFSRSATSSDNGIRRRNAPSCGRCTTPGCTKAKICASSRFPTGRNSTSGNTSPAKTSSCRRFITATGAKWSDAGGCWSL